ncbi:conserved hypothetical protein [Verticillium alfalfae VaMs.102]|uniref:Elongin-C n=1 Tax=Verticillium alfalfae (strain VaMs.102 / ATCC MYA-4576 / FGSC 10136) TaxID=526221 RepID=C9SAI8_VERA1|nr:conserved hypothetical protein [Verticillium alfalfae VaMs.102]EEY15436.1 conserved hypothetical protein [Verticillium alfalfae VaMs.102]
MASYLSQSTHGSENKYVTLVSGDGYEFVLLREAVMISPVIKGMLDPRSQFMEAVSGRCVFMEIRYREREDVPDMDIPVELCLELLVAADYLGLDTYAFDSSLLRGSNVY